MITTVQCSICSQLNNKPRVVVTDFRLHHTCSICDPLCEHQPYVKKNIIFFIQISQYFCQIYLWCKLEIDILFFDRVTATFYTIFRVVNIAIWRIISSNSIFSCFRTLSPWHVIEGRRLPCPALTASRGSGFLHNLFYLLTSISVEVLLSRTEGGSTIFLR